MCVSGYVGVGDPRGPFVLTDHGDQERQTTSSGSLWQWPADQRIIKTVPAGGATRRKTTVPSPGGV